jgi:hypothetical protein
MGAAGLVAPGTLPVVFFRRDVSFFGTTGMAGTVAGSLGAAAGPGAAAVPALEGGTGRGGRVMRTVSFFSCLAASAGGVSAIITFQSFRSIASDPVLSKFFPKLCGLASAAARLYRAGESQP